MPNNSDKLKELEWNVSKAMENLVSVSCEHGEESEETDRARDQSAIAEKELNDYKSELGKKQVEPAA